MATEIKANGTEPWGSNPILLHLLAAVPKADSHHYTWGGHFSGIWLQGGPENSSETTVQLRQLPEEAAP